MHHVLGIEADERVVECLRHELLVAASGFSILVCGSGRIDCHTIALGTIWSKRSFNTKSRRDVITNTQMLLRHSVMDVDNEAVKTSGWFFVLACDLHSESVHAS